MQTDDGHAFKQKIHVILGEQQLQLVALHAQTGRADELSRRKATRAAGSKIQRMTKDKMELLGDSTN